MTNREIRYLVINIPFVIGISYILDRIDFFVILDHSKWSSSDRKWTLSDNETLLLFFGSFLLDLIILTIFKFLILK